jgi:hypothetical protein
VNVEVQIASVIDDVNENTLPDAFPSDGLTLYEVASNVAIFGDVTTPPPGVQLNRIDRTPSGNTRHCSNCSGTEYL